MIKTRASGSKVYFYFMKKGRQARHRIPRNSCLKFILILGDHSLNYLSVVSSDNFGHVA